MEWSLLAFTAYRRARARKGLVVACAAGLLALGAAGAPAVLAQHQGCLLTTAARHPSLVERVQVYAEGDAAADGARAHTRLMGDAAMPAAGAVAFALPCGDYTVVPFPSEQDLSEAWEALPMPRQVHLDRDRSVSVDP